MYEYIAPCYEQHVFFRYQSAYVYRHLLFAFTYIHSHEYAIVHAVACGLKLLSTPPNLRADHDGGLVIAEVCLLEVDSRGR